MLYTTFLTHQPGKRSIWRASVPGLPDCVVEAPTRTEALEKIQQRIAEIASQTEVLHVDVPAALKTPSDQPPPTPQTPWQWFGVFQDDPTWGPLFDEIEQERNQRMLGG